MTTTEAGSVMDRLAAALPGQDPALLRLYALLVLTKGTSTTMEDTHEAWAIWRAETYPEHPWIVHRGDLLSRCRNWTGRTWRRSARSLRGWPSERFFRQHRPGDLWSPSQVGRTPGPRGLQR